MKRVSVIIFPGTNCDHDAVHTYESVLGQTVSTVWHRDRDLKNPDVVVLPGGFAYGDYLRTGALAKISPVMQEVAAFAAKGGPVIGICNGFQILCEAGLLPGVLLQNIRRKFLSQFVHIRVENTKTLFTRNYKQDEIITCPIAHNEGNYFADADTISALEDGGQITFRFCSKSGVVKHDAVESNPNGAANSIAGICNKKGNVVGLMPHPERAVELGIGFIGQNSGLKVFAGSVA